MGGGKDIGLDLGYFSFFEVGLVLGYFASEIGRELLDRPGNPAASIFLVIVL